MWKRIKQWFEHQVAEWGLGHVLALIGSGISLLYGVLLMSAWAPLVAVLVFIAILIAAELAQSSGIIQRSIEWIRNKLGIAPSETRIVASVSDAKIVDDPTSGHLAKLWLYEARFPRFKKELEIAAERADAMRQLFQKARTSEFTTEDRLALDNRSYEFLASLDSADQIYRGCFCVFKNISMMNPYRASTIPISGIEDLPEELRKSFREFHDRLNSIDQLAEEMKNDFKYAINDAQGAISRAAHEAIDKEIERARG